MENSVLSTCYGQILPVLTEPDPRPRLLTQSPTLLAELTTLILTFISTHVQWASWHTLGWPLGDSYTLRVCSSLPGPEASPSDSENPVGRTISLVSISKDSLPPIQVCYSTFLVSLEFGSVQPHRTHRTKCFSLLDTHQTLISNCEAHQLSPFPRGPYFFSSPTFLYSFFPHPWAWRTPMFHSVILAVAAGSPSILLFPL